MYRVCRVLVATMMLAGLLAQPITVAHAQSVSWVRRFGTSEHDEARGVAMDPTGNVLVTGFTEGALAGQTPAGSQDAFVRKLTPDGTEVWTRQFGSSADDVADAVAADSSGNVYVVGFTAGTLPGQVSVGRQDGFIRKYGANGNAVWTRQFGSTGDDEATGVAVDAAGNVLVAGVVAGALPGQTFAGATDAFVRKYDADGNVVWTRQFGGAGDDRANGVKTDSAGNAVVVGSVAGPLPGQASAGSSDAFVDKLAPSGNVIWTRQFGSSATDSANAVAIDPAGNVLVAGTTKGVLPGQSGDGRQDAFLRNLTPDGREVWTRQFGTSGDDEALGVAVNPRGNIVVTGDTTEAFPGQTPQSPGDAFVRAYDSTGSAVWTRQFGFDTEESAATGVTIDAAGQAYVAGFIGAILPRPDLSDVTKPLFGSAFVRKLDASGSDLWNREFGASGTDLASGTATDQAGNIYVVGATAGLPGLVFAGGVDDAFVRRYDASGDVVWTRQFGSVGDDEATGVAVDRAGDVYVVGFTSGTLPGQSATGSVDAFVRKLHANGSDVWTRQLNVAGDDFARGVAVDQAGNVYVAGSSSGQAPLDPTDASGNSFVSKLDANGGVVWTRQFAGARTNAVAVDKAGDVVVAGDSESALPGQTFAGDFVDAFVRKFTTNGTEVWTREFGSSDDDFANGVAVDSAGNVLVAGFTTGSHEANASGTGTDAYVRKFGADGHDVWTRQFDIQLDDLGFGVTVDKADNIYVAGSTSGVFGRGIFGDVFVRRFSPSGSVAWTRQFNVFGDDVAFGVAVDPAANVYVAGETFAPRLRVLRGSPDAFVAKVIQTGSTTAASTSTSPINASRVTEQAISDPPAPAPTTVSRLPATGGLPIPAIALLGLILVTSGLIGRHGRARGRHSADHSDAAQDARVDLDQRDSATSAGFPDPAPRR